MHLAAAGVHLEAFKSLIRYGADLAAESELGLCPIEMAVLLDQQQSLLAAVGKSDPICSGRLFCLVLFLF